MSGATPTLLPSKPIFPLLLPKPPQPTPAPLPKRRVYGHLNAYRDLLREMDDLSDEENEVDDEVSNAFCIALFSHLGVDSVCKQAWIQFPHSNWPFSNSARREE